MTSLRNGFSPASPGNGRGFAGTGRLLLLFAVALVLAGCILPINGGGANGGKGNGGGPQGGEGGGGGTPGNVPVVVVSLGDKMAMLPNPEWTHEYDRPVIAALSPDGQYLLVGRSYGSVRNTTQWSAIAYRADGSELWSKSYDSSRYRTIEVDVIGPQPAFAVSLFTWSNSGDLYLYSSEGKSLWRRPASSSVSLRPNDDGSRVFGIDRGRRELFLAETASGRELASLPVTEGAALQVDGPGNALIVDPVAITLVSPSGKVQGRVSMASDYTSIELSPAGDAVYGASRGADSSVYRFDLAGALVWQAEIPDGGSNSLAISPDGRHVVVYNVGPDNGFLMLNAEDGKPLRQTAFAAVKGAGRQFIKWVRFLPDDGGLLVDYTVTKDPSSGHIEEHSLLWFDESGAYQARCQFGPNADILVAMDGKSCVVVNTMPLDYDAPSTNMVKYFDLEPLYSR